MDDFNHWSSRERGRLLKLINFFSYFLFAQEVIVFPFLNQKMDFASEKEAHEVIFKGITALETLLKEFKADHAKFDPSQIKKSLEEMKEPLVGLVLVLCCHYRWFTYSSLIWMLKSNTSRLTSWRRLVSVKQSLRIWTLNSTNMLKVTETHSSLSHTWCRAFFDPAIMADSCWPMPSHNPPEIQAVWPPMPWFLRKLVIPYVLAKRHSGYVSWKKVPERYLLFSLDIGNIPHIPYNETSIFMFTTCCWNFVCFIMISWARRSYYNVYNSIFILGSLDIVQIQEQK